MNAVICRYCWFCGKAFEVPWTGGQNKRFCSGSCRDRQKVAIRRLRDTSLDRQDQAA